jgi:hypothetical protein
LEEPEVLLWYYALSRDQVMNLVDGVEPNTDMNILSEVRLSALDKNATGDESPYKLLWDNYTLDVNPILGHDAAKTLYRYAQALFRWQEYKSIPRTVKNLYAYDAIKARAVDLELMYRTYDYDSAIAAYEKHKKWPDETHRQMVEIMMELQRYGDAADIVQRIDDTPLRATMKAKLLYVQDKLDRLRGLKANGDGQKLWQLTALAKTDLASAGKALIKLYDTVEFEEQQLRVLIRYFGSIDDKRNMDIFSRRLVTLIDGRVERMTKAVEVALDKKVIARARSLLTRINALNPKAKGVDSLTRRLEALEHSTAVPS